MDINSCLKIVGKVWCEEPDARGGGGGGGGGGGNWRRREREKGYVEMLKAGQSRGSVVCVNGVMHYKA